MEVIDRVFFRKINPSDFRNIYEVAKPPGGNGQTYIEAAGISDDALIDFLQFGEISETKSAAESRFIYTINCYVVGENAVSDWVEFSPRKGRNYKISRQTLAHRHPAWCASNGFPEPTKDASGKYLNSEFSGIIDSLVIYIIRTTYRRYYAGFLNCQMMPSSWPRGIGLEAIFENDRRGMIVFKQEGPGYKADKDNPFMAVMGPCVPDNSSNACVDESSLLAVALKCFTENRQKREWCADALAEKGGRPAVGYVANKALRGISITPQVVQKLEGDQPSHLKSWFNSFCDPKTNKSWIDGVSDADLTGLGPYIAHLLDETKPEVPWPQTLPLSLQKAIKTIADPEKCGMYDKRVHDVLKFFGRAEGEFNPAFTDDDYQDVLHEQRVIRKRLKDLGQKQIVEWDATNNQSKPNNQDSDFLTVNEFLWFVNAHMNEIYNEVKNMNLEVPKQNEVEPGDKKWSDVVSSNPDDMMSRLIAALLTKPFAILAGASGTGKSRLVRKLAYMTCLNKQLQPNPSKKKSIENFKMVQVKPNWHDSTSLLGYRSAVSNAAGYVSTDFVRFILKAHAFPNTPFFACLDEMNLAPVEHYFAEFLSAMESGRVENGEWITDPIIEPGEFSGMLMQLDPHGYSLLPERQMLIEKHGLYIPRNLFVVGTVNMDDTTKGFSRKVLDRAMTVVMDQINFMDLTHPSELVLNDVLEGDVVKVRGLLLKESVIKEFVERKDFDPDTFKDDFRAKLELLRVKLDNTPLAFAYRLARECTQYREAMKMLYKGANPAIADLDELALDHCVFMKLLPRLAGNLDERQAVIKGLNEFIPTLGAKHALSARAFKRMTDAADTNGGYLSFWP
ncbi:MAG: hypothetical protein MJZ42_05135 [Bacteroidales bacterium]|nr:hypothetical protein [Bacteroidales bacterium]